MKRLFRTTALAALLLAALPSAQAATYSFSGMMDSGSLIDQSFFGNFSFDDLGLTGSGFELRDVTSVSLSFAGTNFTLANADAPADVSFMDGNLLGLFFTATKSYAPPGVYLGITFVTDAEKPYLAYERLNSDWTAVDAASGSGTVIYAAVPEPESYAMFLAGLGLIGLAARRRAKGF